MIWFDVQMDEDRESAVLECSRCGYLVVSGGWNNQEHALAPLVREGI